MNHRQLVAQSLAQGAGLTMSDLEAARPLATTMVTIDTFFAIANRSWEEGIAIGSGHERLIRDAGWFGFEVKRLKGDLGWSDEQVAWFAAHDEADEEHGQLIEMLDDYIDNDSAWDRVEEAIVESQIAFMLMLDGIADAVTHDIAPMKGTSCRGLSLIF
jgi:pyrroloquinoline quinone (PQQ) biosynthesis protein C